MSEARRAAAIAAVFFGFIALACSAPDMRDVPKTKPAAADVVGIWRIDATSAAELTQRRGIDVPKSALELRADGSFTWTDTCEALLESPPKPCVPNGFTWIGRWELAESQRHWLVLLRSPDELVRAEAIVFSSTKPYTLGFERPEGETYGFRRDGDVHPFPTAPVPK